MPNFLFVYRGGDEDYAKMTPDEIQGLMKKWTDWIGEGFAKGWMGATGGCVDAFLRLAE
jgi:hypothetical protein